MGLGSLRHNDGITRGPTQASASSIMQTKRRRKFSRGFIHMNVGRDSSEEKPRWFCDNETQDARLIQRPSFSSSVVGVLVTPNSLCLWLNKVSWWAIFCKKSYVWHLRFKPCESFGTTHNHLVSLFVEVVSVSNHSMVESSKDRGPVQSTWSRKQTSLSCEWYIVDMKAARQGISFLVSWVL